MLIYFKTIARECVWI